MQSYRTLLVTRPPRSPYLGLDPTWADSGACPTRGTRPHARPTRGTILVHLGLGLVANSGLIYGPDFEGSLEADSHTYLDVLCAVLETPSPPGSPQGGRT